MLNEGGGEERVISSGFHSFFYLVTSLGQYCTVAESIDPGHMSSSSVIVLWNDGLRL